MGKFGAHSDFVGISLVSLASLFPRASQFFKSEQLHKLALSVSPGKGGIGVLPL